MENAKKESCGSCKYFYKGKEMPNSDHICCNPDSDYCGDYVLEKNWCNEYEQKIIQIN